MTDFDKLWCERFVIVGNHNSVRFKFLSYKQLHGRHGALLGPVISGPDIMYGDRKKRATFVEVVNMVIIKYATWTWPAALVTRP